jgi:hypothetical protein
MEKRLIVCGDSFNIGIGCRDLRKEPYGSLLAESTGRKLVNLAKGSSTNLSIWLQVKYAVYNLNANENDIVLVNETSSERYNWFPEGKEINRELTNLDVNYHDYPPYGKRSYQPEQYMTHPMSNQSEYTGKMITENIAGVIDYLDRFLAQGDNQRGKYYNRLADEPVTKLKLLRDFYTSIHNDQISQIQSRALMTMSHSLLHNKNIKHVMLLPNFQAYQDTVLEQNKMHLSWGELTMKYPDTVGTGHASEQGHIEAFEMILNKLIENGWI